MKSTATITFNLQALDFSPLIRGRVRVAYNDGSNVANLDLALTTGAATTGFFKEVAWVGGIDNDDQQALNYVAAFNRDYRNTGGVLNLVAKAIGNTVIILANVGTFNLVDYVGNVILMNSEIENVINTPPIVSNIQITQIGNCSTINYSVTATGGSPPYILNDGKTNIQTNWDGSPFVFPLDRGIVAKVGVTDSLGEAVSKTFPVPRKLVEGDFSFTIEGDGTSSSVTVNTETVISGTSPLAYSIENLSETSGSNYIGINTFSGVISGQYKVFIKDIFGCEIYKTLNVSSFNTGLEQDLLKYFDINEGQSIIFNEFVSFDSLKQKNYFNTGSYNEATVGQRYNARQFFSKQDGFIGTQFKSSYPYHAVTLHNRNGNKKDIPLIMISENIGLVEKMDCVRFPLSTGNTGVYFNGGNTYVPNTDTVLGVNTFNGITPQWAVVGQLVFLDGIGLRISGNGFDENRGWYFILDLITANERAGKIQLTFNKQDYNLFEFYINSAEIEPCDTLIVEKGYDIGVFDGLPWVSENIYPLEYNEDYLFVQWSDTKNRGGIVFQSGIKYMARFQGEFIPKIDAKSESFSGDSNEFSIEQLRKLNFDVLIEGISFKQAVQLSIASALSGFSINGISLVSKEPPETKRLDKSNLWTWSGVFAFGGNLVSVQQDQTVLSVGTGVIGGGSTGKTPQIDISDVVLYRDQNGNLVVSDNSLIFKQ